MIIRTIDLLFVGISISEIPFDLRLERMSCIESSLGKMRWCYNRRSRTTDPHRICEYWSRHIVIKSIAILQHLRPQMSLESIFWDQSAEQ